MKSHRRNRKPPAMALLAALFMSSAVIRAIDPAIALAVEVPGLAEGDARVEEARVADEFSYSDLDGLLKTIRQREAQLNERDAKVAEKENLMRAAEQKLRDQLARLEEAESRLGSLLRLADQAADKDVDKLVTTFQSMDDKKAGPIFENMDVPFAAGLISRMDGVAAANILSVLTPAKAYAITVHIAGQNAQVPRE
ncbi:MAG: hypothetical protein AAF367_15530 [Pseudomonadota bacterium]